MLSNIDVYTLNCYAVTQFIAEFNIVGRYPLFFMAYIASQRIVPPKISTFYEKKYFIYGL